MFKMSKNMKLGICGFAALTLISLTAASTWADDFYADASGDEWTDQGDTADGATMTITLSPGVKVQAYTADAIYGLAAQNDNVAVDDRIEYGISSLYPGYYMRPAAADYSAATLTILSATSTGDFSGWTEQ